MGGLCRRKDKFLRRSIELFGHFRPPLPSIRMSSQAFPRVLIELLQSLVDTFDKVNLDVSPEFLIQVRSIIQIGNSAPGLKNQWQLVGFSANVFLTMRLLTKSACLVKT